MGKQVAGHIPFPSLLTLAAKWQMDKEEARDPRARRRRDDELIYEKENERNRGKKKGITYQQWGIT